MSVKKLTLAKETLRALGDSALRNVAGGWYGPGFPTGCARCGSQGTGFGTATYDGTFGCPNDNTAKCPGPTKAYGCVKTAATQCGCGVTPTDGCPPPGTAYCEPTINQTDCALCVPTTAY